MIGDLLSGDHPFHSAGDMAGVITTGDTLIPGTILIHGIILTIGAIPITVIILIPTITGIILSGEKTATITGIGTRATIIMVSGEHYPQLMEAET
jgi:hypothetical protein